MSVAFTCPQCQQGIAAESPAGSAVSCPFCGRVVTVPVPGGLPPPVQTVPFAVSTPDAPIGYATRSGEPPPRQGLAVAALVCGIAGVVTCFPLFGLAGVVLGIIALVRVNRDSRRHAGKGLALGGLCTGIAGLVMLPVLMIILLPSLGRARELSKRTLCQANLRGLAQAMYIYAQEGNKFPEVGADWQARLLTDGSISPRMLICPGDLSGNA